MTILSVIVNYVEALGLRVPIRSTESVRKYLMKHNMIRRDLYIEKCNDYVYLPLSQFPLTTINSDLQLYEMVRKKFRKKPNKPTTYKDIALVPNQIKPVLPTSYDIIGDIAIIKLPEKLIKYKQEISEALIQSNRNIKVVCLDEGVIGEFRVRKLHIIAGEKRTTTSHKEFDATFEMDIQKVYYSPRLASERKRIADQVQSGEIVIDLFAGVAPFSIMIAKYADPKLVYAIDKNKDAVFYAKKNIVKNNVLDKVEITEGDVKKIIPKLIKKNVTADRIIMNLPFSSSKFFEKALPLINKKGIIHYYEVLDQQQITSRIRWLKHTCTNYNAECMIKDQREIKTYSPRELYIGVDIEVKKRADVA